MARTTPSRPYPRPAVSPPTSDQIVVRRVDALKGTIDVPGAKNAVLKLMAATILADGTYELSNVPRSWT